jgi:hypothetical protein
MSTPATPEPGRGNADLRRRMLFVPEVPSTDTQPGISDDGIALTIPGLSVSEPNNPFNLPDSAPAASNPSASFTPGATPMADASNGPLLNIDDLDIHTLRQNYQQLLADYNYAVQVVEEAVRIEEEYKTVKEQNEALVAELAEYRRQLDERTAEVESLRQQYQEVKAQLEEFERELASGHIPGMPAAPPVPRTEGDLEALANELEQERVRLAQERRRLEEEKRQFREEQEEDNRQLRQEEARMARERAMMARQEMALRQLNEDIRKQLALLQSGGNSMQETLKQFQRRQLEANARNTGPGSTPGVPPQGAPQPGANPGQASSPQPTTAPKGRDSGLIRRFFGQGGSGK